MIFLVTVFFRMGAYIVDEKKFAEKSSGQFLVFFLIYNDWFELY